MEAVLVLPQLPTMIVPQIYSHSIIIITTINIINTITLSNHALVLFWE
jgi:hypothetical protein